MSDVRLEQEHKLRNEKIVKGYVRRVHHTLIPIDIINLCIMFYHVEMDEIDPNYLSPYHLIKKRGILKHNHRHIGSKMKQSTSLFRRCVSNGKHEWKFKLINNGWIIIGICRRFKSHYSPNDTFTKYGNGYGYDISNGAYEPRTWSSVAIDAMRCKKNDIIEMCLDLNNLTLSFAVNGNNKGVAFKGIESAEYKAAIHTYCGRESVQLLEYRKLD